MRGVCYVPMFISVMVLSSITTTVHSNIEIDTKIGCRLRHPGQICNSNDVRFTLFNSFDQGIELDINDPIAGPGFNPEFPMKVVCHGFEGGIRLFNPTYLIKEAYLQLNYYNVIMVDWSRLSTVPCYNVALMNTKFVGECTGQLLVALERSYPTFKARETHVIGFSMGSQVAAETSRTVERLTGNKLVRVTALDPRQSRSYKAQGYTWFVDPTCAHLVDVIYTLAGDQGREEMKGSVEFYVNGGSAQKQCSQSLVKSVCNHLTAPVYYAESITSPIGFFGVKCPGLAEYQAGKCPDNQAERVPMGQLCCWPGTSGRYYVTTESTSPYALGRLMHSMNPNATSPRR